jgi:hypothetical protein
MFVPADFAEATIFYDLEGQGRDDAQVVFGVHPTAVNVSAANAIFGVFADAFEDILTTQGNMTRCVLRDSVDATFVSTAGDRGGTENTAGDAPQVALLAKKGTALGGREHRGRMFFPGTSENNVLATGRLTSGALTTFQDTLDEFMTELAGLDCGFVLLHTNPATAPDDILTFLASPVCATQRRRLKR